jgi:succinate dehydrogenase cytochrome b subunit
VAAPTTTPPAVFRTSIGKKLLMAGSGVILLGFVIAHMIGNLHIYLGKTSIDLYAHGLRTMLEPELPFSYALWAIRVVLIAAFAIHIVTAVQLARQSRAARSVRYVHPDHVQADPAAVSMRWGGLALALFIVFHLANLTWGWVHPGFTFVRGAVYANLVGSFQVWWIVVIYLVAMVALSLHIYHGAWSIFQTFGVNNKRWDKRVRVSAAVVAVVVLIGNCSIPIAIAAGGIK